MKKLLITLVLTSFLISVNAQNLRAYYKFDNSLNDLSGNNYHGTSLGDPSYQNGFKCQSVGIGNNTNDAISVDHNVLEGLSDFTIAFYAKIYDLNNSNNFISGATRSHDNEFLLQYNAVGYYQNKGWQLVINSTHFSFDSDTTLNDKNWHYIVVVRQGNKARLYIDNVKIGNDIIVDTEIIDIDARGLIIGQDQDCVSGCFQQGQSWNGEIDELRVYEGALSSSETEAIYVLTSMNKKILGNDTTLCEGETLTLDASSTLGPATYSWYKDNNPTPIANTVTLEVNSAGTYWVEVTTPSGTSADTINVTFSRPIFDIDLGPDITVCDSGVATIGPNRVSFAAIYSWSPGEAATPYIDVTSAGTYILSAIDNGCPTADTINVRVTPQLPVDLGTDAFLCEGKTLTLDASIPAANYLWQDGSTSSTYTVTKPGTYSVDVSAYGCGNSDTITINYSPNPIVSLGVDTVLCEGATLPLDATNPGAIYLWQDGSTIPISTNSTFTVMKPGTYSVNVTIGNCSDSDAIEVRYHEPAMAEFTYTDNGNGNYSFTNTSTGNFNISKWNFGDGNISSITHPNHTFNANGIYPVVLAITDSFSYCTEDIYYYKTNINVISVSNPVQCQGGFTFCPDTNTTNKLLVFNSSIGTNLSYSWDFGDGDISSLKYPTHSYTTAGPFQLCLTVNDGNGCIDTFCDSITDKGVVFTKSSGFDMEVIAPISTGINDESALTSNINIYPNPTSGQITIVSKGLTINKINMINITGKTVKTITKNINLINVADLPSGIYFMEVTGEEGSIVKKLVKR